MMQIKKCQTFVGLIISALPFASMAADTAATSQKEAAAAAIERLPASLVQMPELANYYSPYAFVVDKKSRTLTVWQQDKSGTHKVASFPADLGRNEGDKKNQGDRKTPSGIYFLEERFEGANLNFSLYGKRAFTTSYPNFFDRREGKTGSGIWLHAVPDNVALTRGSRGCVVVRNDVIMDLTQYIKLHKTPIIIQDEVQMEDPVQAHQTTLQMSQMVETWRQAWEKRDIESYISFYSDDFEAMKMNRDQWKSYKAHLNETYKALTVKLSRPVIYAYKNHAVARFLQAYTSDQHADFGEKVLYLSRKDGGPFKITGEEWAADDSTLARAELDASASTVSSTANASANQN
jgi:murein L,D-transpeptidase YafK